MALYGALALIEAIIPFVLHLGTTGLCIAIFATEYGETSPLSRSGLVLKFILNFFVAVQFMFFHRAWAWNLAHLTTITLYTIGRFPAGGGNGALTALDRAFIYYGFIIHGILIWFNPLVMRLAKRKLAYRYLETFDPNWSPETQSRTLRLIAWAKESLLGRL